MTLQQLVAGLALEFSTAVFKSNQCSTCQKYLSVKCSEACVCLGLSALDRGEAVG